MFTKGMNFADSCALSSHALFCANHAGMISILDTILVSIFIAILGIIRPVLVIGTGKYRAVPQ